MRTFLVSAAVALIGVTCGGCASHAALASDRKPQTVTTAVTIESSDHRLAAALLAEQMLPSAESHLAVAREYVRLGILDAAQTRTTQALASAPRFAAAHEMMARIWRDWGQPAAALPHVQRAIFYDAGSASAQNTLGTILDALGRVDGARAAFTRAFELDATAGWALSNLCYLEFRQGRFEQARQYCEAALRVAPTLAEAHNNLGLTHAAMGDLTGAKQAFLATGDVAAAYYNLGIVHLSSRRYEAAAEAFAAAIKARPEFSAAKSRAHEARMLALAGNQGKSHDDDR